METKEFSVFRALLAEVHTKAFGEPLARLSHGKAQTLTWMIHDATGQLLSYKSLANYVQAVLDLAPHKVNPNCSTLSILVQFVADTPLPAVMRAGQYVAWFQYRSQRLVA